MTRARENANLLAQTATGNINLSGILTVGAGGTTSIIQVGTGSTIHGSGDIAIAGTVYAYDLVVPLKIDSFSPADGESNVSVNSDIRITFSKAIGVGSTGYVILEGGGSVIESISVGSTQISRTDVNKTLVITPSAEFIKSVPGVAYTVTPVVQASFINDSSFAGINTTGSSITYDFSTEAVAVGASYQGGYLTCLSGGVQYIVAPNAAERSLSWTSRASANSTAQSITGCTDWFIPTGGELSSAGYSCRQYWDSYSVARYWSNTQAYPPGPQSRAVWVPFAGYTGGETLPNLGQTNCVRSFRCVTY